jgi:hypothetical protein
MRNLLLYSTLVAVAAALLGCEKPMHFPAASMPAPAEAAGAARAYDTNGDGAADFFLFADDAGRFDRLGYDLTGDARPDTVVKLDAIPAARCRHLMIILDGLHYDLVKKHYDAGHLRLFHPPSRVVAPYPTMTDLAVEDFLDYMPCLAFEAQYYDHEAGKVVGGKGAYLAGRNEPYNRLLQYRASLIWVPLLYLWPRAVFGRELNQAKRAFDKGATQEMLAYFSSTAGMGTRLGAAGQIECLEGIERLINQIVHETRGLTKVTMIADHGHGYQPAERIDFKKLLAEKGWRVAGRLREPKDVVLIKFGLTTYASFYTTQRAALASDLVGIEGVSLASYAEDGAAVVVAPGAEGPQRARIREKAGRFAYEPLAGDPLALKPVLAKLKADKEGFYDDRAVLHATATHEWPDPLQRIWRAHFALVENPADVIVSLDDDACVGSDFFAAFVSATSTHGSLNYRNSVTFIMSTAGPLPPLMRSADVPRHMGKLFGRPWPMRK